MKFTQLLKNLILEQSRFEILFDALTKPSVNKEGKKLKPKLKVSDFVEIVKADPTTRLNNVDLENLDKKDFSKVKAGKYVQWLIKRFLSPTTETQPGQFGYEREVENMKDRFIEDLYKVTEDLKKFDKFKNTLEQDKRNIDNIKSTRELYELVKDFSLEKTKATAEEKKQAVETYEHPGAKVEFRGSEWTVVKISDQSELGRNAAQFYGGYGLTPSQGETSWCTSAPSLQWFDRYIKKGPLYVIIPNNWTGKRGVKSGLPATRYQFHFQDNQFMDPADHSINLVEFLNGQMSELKGYFKPEFAKNLTDISGSGNKLEINSFSSGSVGKYIALYGIEDIFNNLPEDTTDILISNKDRNDVIITIPDSISKYKNLVQIMFSNCVDRVPDSICDLKELRFISFTNNSQLKEIPECVAELPYLSVLNLGGSDNVRIPETVKEKAEEFGNNRWWFGDEEDIV